MPTKRATLKDYTVSFKVEAIVNVTVAAASPEEALAKGRDLQGDVGNFLADDLDDIMDGSAEVRGLWSSNS